MVTDFTLYYKAKLIKTVWDWYQYRHIDHWTRRESLEWKTYIYGQLISENEAKNTQWEEDGLFTNGTGKTR